MLSDRTRAKVQRVDESGVALQRVLDNLFAFVGVLLPDGTLTEANRAPLEAAGIDIDDVRGLKFWDCSWWNYAPEPQELVRDAVERARSGQVVRFDVPVRMAGDTRMWIDFQIAPLRDERGVITHLIPSAMDITERKRADDALRASEERFRAVQQMTPDGFMLFESLRDPGTNRIVDFVWTFVNPAAERIVGRNAGDLIGKQLLVEMPGNLEEGLFDAYVGVVETGRVWQREFAYDHDGIDRWFRSTAAKTGDGFAVSFADITARVQAERERDRRRREFQSLVENSPDIVVRFDRELRYLYANPALERLTGMPVETHLGKSNSQLGMPSELVHQLERESRAAFESGSERYFEFPFPTPEGTRHFRARLVPETGVEADATLLCVIYDVTARVRAESERRTLLDALAHDLKNPLAVLRVQSQLERRRIARRGLPDAATLDERLAAFETLSVRMTELVEELADHARLALGDAVEMDLVDTDLGEVVRIAVADTVPLEGSHSVELDDEGGLVGLWDPQRLRRVAVNLLSNAVKYSPDGGAIRVSTFRDGDAAVLEVQDQGIGIPAADLPHVFSLRHRAGNVGVIAGSGIGLAGVKQIVAQHGGVVDVSSEEGAGTSVVVRLPLIPPQAGYG